MMVNNYVLYLCIMGLFISVIFSETDVLWDFGVIIKQPSIQDNSKEAPNKKQNKPGIIQPKINALITDPFIPPVRSTFSAGLSDPLLYSLPESILKLIEEKNINQIEVIAKKYYLNKNYKYVIKLLIKTDVSMVPDQKREDLRFLLANAFYNIGKYKDAEDQVLSLLKQNKSDRLYLLLAMIYESIGEKKFAKENYLKLISQYPDSEYITSAKIKYRILSQH